MVTSLSQLDLSKSYSYADYLLWRFEERVELIRGKIMQMAAPSRIHQQVATNMIVLIGSTLRKSHCKIFPAPFDVRLPHYSPKKNLEVITVVQPDLCVICDPSKLDEKGCVGAPDIVVEILSPGNSKREMKDKFSVYEESGVKEYWLVSPTEKAVQVFRLNENGQFIGIQPYTEDDSLTTPILPGLSIPLREVFAD